MSAGRMWRILLYLCAALSVVVVPNCEAILNIAETNGAICDSDVCKCTSRGVIVVTCSCSGSRTQEVDLRGTYQPHANTNNFRIENCRRVIVNANTFAYLQNLRRIEMVHIAEIVVKENSFSWKANESLIQEQFSPSVIPSGIIINIANSSIPSIPSFAFKGRLESILIQNVQIGTVSAFAFTNLKNTHSLEFINTDFNNLQAQAFKKFTVMTLTLSGGNYGSLPSRTMVDVQVIKTLLIEKVSAATVHSSAFVVAGCESFKIDRCSFTRVEGDAFRVVTRSPIYIENCGFATLLPGAFAGITVGDQVFSKQKHQKLFFQNNNITNFEPGALVFNVTRVEPQLDAVTIEQVCSCNLTVSLTITHRPSNVRQPNKDKSVNKDSTAFLCQVDERNQPTKRYITFQEYNTANCGLKTSSFNIILIIVISSLFILLVLAVAIICICRRRKHRNNQKWKYTTTSNPTYEQDTRKFDKRNKKGPDSRITMVVPDGRVYRETELHVIVEQAEPINDQPINNQPIYQNLTMAEHAEPLIPAGQKPVPRPRTKLP